MFSLFSKTNEGLQRRPLIPDTVVSRAGEKTYSIFRHPTLNDIFTKLTLSIQGPDNNNAVNSWFESWGWDCPIQLLKIQHWRWTNPNTQKRELKLSPFTFIHQHICSSCMYFECFRHEAHSVFFGWSLLVCLFWIGNIFRICISTCHL